MLAQCLQAMACIAAEPTEWYDARMNHVLLQRVWLATAALAACLAVASCGEVSGKAADASRPASQASAQDHANTSAMRSGTFVERVGMTETDRAAQQSAATAGQDNTLEALDAALAEMLLEKAGPSQDASAPAPAPAPDALRMASNTAPEPPPEIRNTAPDTDAPSVLVDLDPLVTLREHEALRDEVGALRETVAALQDEIGTLTDVYLEDLREENKRLRDELRRLFALRMMENRATPIVPRPGDDGLLQRLREEAAMDAMEQAGAYDPAYDPEAIMRQAPPPPPAVREEAPQPEDPLQETPLEQEGVLAVREAAGVRYAVLDEWGRTPEAMAQLAEGLSTLKGMTCAVAAGVPRDELLAMAKALRQEFDQYDNINIEVFEGVANAREYLETGDRTGGHLRLTVSKHASSGKDMILLTQGDEIEVIPWRMSSEPASAPGPEEGPPVLMPIEPDLPAAE